jgi:hypothetical protein
MPRRRVRCPPCTQLVRRTEPMRTLRYVCVCHGGWITSVSQLGATVHQCMSARCNDADQALICTQKAPKHPGRYLRRGPDRLDVSKVSGASSRCLVCVCVCLLSLLISYARQKDQLRALCFCAMCSVLLCSVLCASVLCALCRTAHRYVCYERR